MKKVIAVVLSAVLVALLVTGSVVSEDMESENAQVDISGNWTVEYQCTYVSPPEAPDSGKYNMTLYQSGSDVAGSSVFHVTPTIEFKAAITGELYDGDTIVLTEIQVVDGYIGITKLRGNVSLDDTISGTYMGSNNFGKVWEGIFNAKRPPVQASETTPPASVSNLKETAVGCTWINWTWTNPPDADFSHVMVYDMYGVLKTNVSGAPGEMSYLNISNIEPFEPSKTYTICTHTVDTYGNINYMWVNGSATTLPAPITPVPTPSPTPTPTPPGFEAIFAIAALLATAHLVLIRKK